jgi:hypothetical protein
MTITVKIRENPKISAWDKIQKSEWVRIRWDIWTVENTNPYYQIEDNIRDNISDNIWDNIWGETKIEKTS